MEIKQINFLIRDQRKGYHTDLFVKLCFCLLFQINKSISTLNINIHTPYVHIYFIIIIEFLLSIFLRKYTNEINIKHTSVLDSFYCPNCIHRHEQTH